MRGKRYGCESVAFIRRVFSSRPSNVDLAPAPLAGVFFCWLALSAANVRSRCHDSRRNRWSLACEQLIVPPKRVWRGKAIDARRSAAMPVTHEPWLVVLSIVVAIQGAYVGLSMAVQVGEAVGLRRRLLLA